MAAWEDFVDIGAIEEFPEGKLVTVSVRGQQLLVARVGDQIYAADARCPHMGGHLDEGELTGTVVTCPLHHSQFNLADGR